MLKSKRPILNVLLVALTALISAPLYAQEEGDNEAATETPSADDISEAQNLTQYDRIRALSRKKFLKRGRFALNPFGSVSLNDQFFQHFNGGARLGYHLVESLALEVGGASIVSVPNEQTIGIVREQKNAVNADSTLFGYLDVGVTFSPVYGKFAVLNEWIINFDGFVSAGVGAVIDSGRSIAHPTMEVGIGMRAFLNRWLVLRTEVRDYVYPQDANQLSTLQTLLMFNVGVEVYFPFDFEYRYQAAKIVE